MTNKFLSSPVMMNMGFHYSEQYSRRNRIKVMGLVDQSSDEWLEWYLKAHKKEALKKIADAGYGLIEIHFLYGYGLKGESVEIERTTEMVKNAHEAGIKVLGYFQFFSVQEELLFIENPWANDCLQYDCEGKRHQYAYDRPALCFSHEKVRQYYLDGVETGLKDCGLDGIRLDNDYFKGCYCDRCKERFHNYLSEKFSSADAKRVFGFEDLSNITMPPRERPGYDPAWLELCKFRQMQRQNMMREIHSRIVAIKPDGILGGNPAMERMLNNDVIIHVYPVDLGATHHLICAENSSFPAVTGDSLRSQCVLYKFGECADFKVFPSHHLHRKDHSTRWPENAEECARSHFEALTFGGHIPCTTWGIRMDTDGQSTLYERDYFMKATRAVTDFLKENADLYKDYKCDASCGILINRESRIADAKNSLTSLYGTVQVLLRKKIPFRFVPAELPERLDGIELLIVPDVKLMSEETLGLLKSFSERGGTLLMTGDSAKYDEYYLRRSVSPREMLKASERVIFLEGAPEKVDAEEIGFRGALIMSIPYPGNAETFETALDEHAQTPCSFKGGKFAAVNSCADGRGHHLLHIFNYDNLNPTDIEIELSGQVSGIEVIQPEHFGAASHSVRGHCVSLKNFSTYCIIKYRE